MATTVTPTPEQQQDLPAVSLAPARTRARWLSRGLDLIVFAAVYLVLFDVLNLQLVFERTTAAGGDLGSHHYVATFLRTELLPEGRVTGWAPGWYAGIPMLTFYFPLPYALIAALTPLLGDQVAFKLVSASGLLLLPLTSWGALRVLRLPSPAPAFAAVATLPFLFMTSYTIYGGNIASTMAGEFPFSFSFALLPLTLAVLWRVAEDGRWWKRATLLVAAVVLSHILTTIVLCVGALILLVRPHRREVLLVTGRMVRVFGLAFCLTAFWAMAFIFRVEYTAHFLWTQLTDLRVIAPVEIRPYLVLTVVGLVAAVVRRQRQVLYLAWPVLGGTVAFLVLMWTLPEGPLWNARMLPYVYLFSMLVAAYGASVVAARLAGWIPWVTGVSARVAQAAIALLLIAVMAYVPWSQRDFLPSWSAYNYSGFETKPGWGEAQDLFRTLDGLPEGRVMWEFSREYERFGTTRTLENIPVYTRQASMEGLLIESSLNGPFHFVNQAETSATSTQAVPGVDYPGYDFEQGLEHLRWYGVRYLVAYTDQVKQSARSSELPLVTTSGQFEIYEVSDGGLVAPLPNRPVRFDREHWRDYSLDWYRTDSAVDVPMVFEDPGDPRLEAFTVESGVTPPGALPQVPTGAATGNVSSRMVGNEELRFTTDQVGVPHVVRVAWFPNWRVEGADGPWLLSPGLMVVVPTQEEVRLTYGDTWLETTGKVLTVAGVFTLLGATVWQLRTRLRRRPEPAGSPR